MSEDQHITEVAGTGVPIPGDDIDTDQILPARFMKEVTFDNMAEYLFYDARRDGDDLYTHGCYAPSTYGKSAAVRSTFARFEYINAVVSQMPSTSASCMASSTSPWITVSP